MMQNKKIYIITGSIGTGKSTFSKILKERGFFVIDSDKIVHSLYKKKEIMEEIVKKFGDTILFHGNINRKILGEIIFNNKDKKKSLENIVHPKVIDEILNIISSTCEEIIFIEIPLYSHVENELILKVKDYKLIVISTDEDIRIKRIMNRNNISEKQALLLVKNMSEDMAFSKKIDYIIMNNKDIVFLEKLVDKFIMDERLNESIKSKY